MTRRVLFKLALALGSFLLVNGVISYAQVFPKPPKSFILLYNNNMNGETDPCPG